METWKSWGANHVATCRFLGKHFPEKKREQQMEKDWGRSISCWFQAQQRGRCARAECTRGRMVGGKWSERVEVVSCKWITEGLGKPDWVQLYRTLKGLWLSSEWDGRHRKVLSRRDTWSALQVPEFFSSGFFREWTEEGQGYKWGAQSGGCCSDSGERCWWLGPGW